jgi:hypothetical protein
MVAGGVSFALGLGDADGGRANAEEFAKWPSSNHLSRYAIGCAVGATG